MRYSISVITPSGVVPIGHNEFKELRRGDNVILDDHVMHVRAVLMYPTPKDGGDPDADALVEDLGQQDEWREKLRLA